MVGSVPGRERESRRGGARTRSGGACSLLNLWDAPILPYRTLFGLCFQPLAHESRRQPAFAVHTARRCTSPLYIRYICGGAGDEPAFSPCTGVTQDSAWRGTWRGSSIIIIIIIIIILGPGLERRGGLISRRDLF